MAKSRQSNSFLSWRVGSAGVIDTVIRSPILVGATRRSLYQAGSELYGRPLLKAVDDGEESSICAWMSLGYPSRGYLGKGLCQGPSHIASTLDDTRDCGR